MPDEFTDDEKKMISEWHLVGQQKLLAPHEAQFLLEWAQHTADPEIKSIADRYAKILGRKLAIACAETPLDDAALPVRANPFENKTDDEIYHWLKKRGLWNRESWTGPKGG